MPKTRSHGQYKPVEPPVATQPTKRKRGPKKKTTAEEIGTTQEVQSAVNKRIAELEAARPCDNDVPTPRPQSDGRRSSTLSQTNSRADISALIAQQRRANQEVADGSAVGDITKPSGFLFENDSNTDDDTDDEEDQSPTKKPRKVVIPDPVTPVAARLRRPTAVEKHDMERAKWAAKEAERLAKEEAKVKKAAERQAKAQAKEEERERKAEEKRVRAREKATAKEAKDLERKTKRAKVNGDAQAADSHDVPLPVNGSTALTGTKANASGKEDNAGGEQMETEREEMEERATVATGRKGKVSVCGESDYLAYLSSD
jgi:hypothetical protein